MKNKLLILFLLISLVGKSQSYVLYMIDKNGSAPADSFYVKMTNNVFVYDSIYKKSGVSYIPTKRPRYFYLTPDGTSIMNTVPTTSKMTDSLNARIASVTALLSNYSLSNHTHTGVYQPVGSYLTAADITGKLNKADSGRTLSSNYASAGDLGKVKDSLAAILAPKISPTLTTPVIGVATGTSLAVTGAINSSGTAGIGYATGAGGTVSQATNKSTGVTLNKTCGQITMVNSALAAAAEVSFTLTNSTIAANDVVVVSIKSGATAGAYFVTVGATAAGSCSTTLGNTSTGSLSEAVVLNFVVIKGVNN